MYDTPELHHIVGSRTAKTTSTRRGEVPLCIECGWVGPAACKDEARELSLCHEEDAHPNHDEHAQYTN